MWKQCIISIILLGLTLVVVQYNSLLSFDDCQINCGIFGRVINRKISNLDDSINIGFSAFEYEQEKLQETKLQNEYDLSAILLHWTRLKGVERTVKYLLLTNFFKEIIIWNNNPNVNLTVNHIDTDNHLKKFIRIINSKINLKDEAKYRACTEAKTRACFYVDDDWNASYYLKSLIASFRSDPNLLHAVTDPYTYYTNIVWSYFDKTIDLHSGFSWIGCGSIFLRQHAEHHLQLIHKYLANYTDLIPLSDVFFSIWLNDLPVQMNARIYNQPSSSTPGSVPFSSTARFAELQYLGSVFAIRILEHSLRFEQSTHDNITFPRKQNRRLPYYVKSPSFKDDFIFYSNILPYDMENVSFNISRDFERGTRKNLPGGLSVKHFSDHGTLKAVDDDLSTCWLTNRDIRPNDFFAIDFLYIQTGIIFKLDLTNDTQMPEKLDMGISFDGLRWLSYQGLNGIYRKINETTQQLTYLFDSNEFNLGFKSFRYFSFKATEKSDRRLEVCEIQIISGRNITNIKHDFHQLNV